MIPGILIKWTADGLKTVTLRLSDCEVGSCVQHTYTYTGFELVVFLMHERDMKQGIWKLNSVEKENEWEI